MDWSSQVSRPLMSCDAELKIRLWVWLAKLNLDWPSAQFVTIMLKFLGGHCRKLHSGCYFEFYDGS